MLRSMEQKRKRYEEALNGAVDFFPGTTVSIVPIPSLIECNIGLVMD